MNHLSLTALAIAGALAPAAGGAAEATTDAAPVVVIVRIPKPWYAPRPLLVQAMRDTIPQYGDLSGLAFKAYAIEHDSKDFGGIYYWRDGASARAWFTPAWVERVRKERGSEPRVRFFDAPLSLDNVPGGTPASSDSASVATLVEIAIPAGLPRERILAGFAAAVPSYRATPGLLRKHFTLGERETFGGVYLWRDEASARAWFDAGWHERVRQAYGAEARVEWFDTPILLPSRNAHNSVSPSQLLLTLP